MLFSKKNERRQLLPILIAVFIDLIGLGIAIPVLSVLMLDPSVNVLGPAASEDLRTITLGFLIGLYPLAQFFGAPILGGMSDFYGRKKMLLIALLGTAAGYILFAAGVYFENIYVMLLSRILGGFMGGNLSIAHSAVADISTPQNKGRNFGLIGMAFGLGFILGPFLGTLFSDPNIVRWFSFSTPFFVAGILTILNVIYMSIFFPETLKTKKMTEISLLTGIRNIKKGFKLKNIRVMMIVIFTVALGFSFYTQFAQVYLIKTFGLGLAEIGKIFAYIGIWVAIAQGVINQPIALRFKPEKIVRISMFAMSIAVALTLIPTEVKYLYFVIPFIAISQGVSNPNNIAIVSNLTKADSQGEMLGINLSLQALAQAIPPMISGFIAIIDPGLPIVVSSSVILVAWLIFIAFFDHKKQQKFASLKKS